MLYHDSLYHYDGSNTYRSNLSDLAKMIAIYHMEKCRPSKLRILATHLSAIVVSKVSCERPF